MLSASEIRTAARARGFRAKTKNLLAVALSGFTLAFYSCMRFPHSIAGILSGLVAGFIYANGFEYVLHRFLSHAGHGIFAGQHRVHHTTWNAPEAARYVNFSSNP